MAKKHPLDGATPLGNRVLIRRDPTIKVSAGGISYTDKSQGVRMTGTVLLIGPGKTSDEGIHIPVEGIKVGDRVLFTRFAAERVEDEVGLTSDDMDELVLVAGDHLLAKLPPLTD